MTEHRDEERLRRDDVHLGDGVALRLDQQLLAPTYRLVRRHRTQEKRDCEPLESLTLLEYVTGRTGMDERSLRRVDTRAPAPRQILRLGGEPPGASKPKVVVEAREDVGGATRGLKEIL